MKKFSFLITTILVLIISACQMARFDRVPGFEQMAIPPQFQGKFILKTGSYKNLIGSDSIALQIDGNTIKITNKNATFTKNIRQDFQVSEFRGITLIAIADKNIPSLWNLFALEMNKGDLLVYPFIDTRITNEDLSVLNSYLPAQPLMLSHDPIVPPPSNVGGQNADGSSAPVVNPMGGLPSSLTYNQMMEEQFEQLFSNEMRGKTYIQFNHVVTKPATKKK